jgi:hypothetical protein
MKMVVQWGRHFGTDVAAPDLQVFSPPTSHKPSRLSRCVCYILSDTWIGSRIGKIPHASVMRRVEAFSILNMVIYQQQLPPSPTLSRPRMRLLFESRPSSETYMFAAGQSASFGVARD